MVCCARDFPVLWTIVRGWLRRESESLHDRARSGRLRALNVAPSVSFLVSVRGRSREGIPAAAGGLHAASLAIRLRVSCYAPMRPPPHPRAPSRRATNQAASRVLRRRSRLRGADRDEPWSRSRARSVNVREPGAQATRWRSHAGARGAADAPTTCGRSESPRARAFPEE